MRIVFRLVLVLTVALVVSACGGGGDATQAPPADADATATASSGDEIGTILTPATEVVPQGVPGNEPDELEVPLPGTLVASATEDPEAGLIFSHIRFEMTSGPNEDDTTLVIELTGDGQLTRDGAVSMVGPDVVLRIDSLLDELNFFGLQGTFLGPSPDTDGYRYRLTVTRGESERMINAQDGYTPTNLKRLFSSLADLGLTG